MRPLKAILALFCVSSLVAADFQPLPEFVEAHTAAKADSDILLTQLQGAVVTARVEISELQASAVVSVDKIAEQEAEITELNAKIAQLESAPPPATAGLWRVEYFANKTLSGSPVRTATEFSVGGRWGDGSPKGLPSNLFSIRYTGSFAFAGGSTSFWVRVDDGVRVYLDGVLIINEWRRQTARNFGVIRQVTAGVHELKIEYFDDTSVAELWFAWQ